MPAPPYRQRPRRRPARRDPPVLRRADLRPRTPRPAGRPASRQRSRGRRQRAAARAALTKELARIDVAQRNQILQIDGLSPDPADKAAQAMRARCSQRFTELHTERETIEAQITAIDSTPARDDHAELLDRLPVLSGNLSEFPERIQAVLYQAFDLQLLYNKDMHQVTIWATITSSTPHAVAAIIPDASHPAPATATPGQPAPAPAPAMSALTQRPIAPQILRDHGKGDSLAAGVLEPVEIGDTG